MKIPENKIKVHPITCGHIWDLNISKYRPIFCEYLVKLCVTKPKYRSFL